MRTELLRKLLFACLIVTACSSDKQISAPERVCQAFVELDETTFKPGDADKAFAMVADKVQPELDAESPMWQVLEVLRNVVTEQRYEMYIFTGDELGENWRCEEMRKLLSL